MVEVVDAGAVGAQAADGEPVQPAEAGVAGADERAAAVQVRADVLELAVAVVVVQGILINARDEEVGEISAGKKDLQAIKSINPCSKLKPDSTGPLYAAMSQQ